MSGQTPRVALVTGAGSGIGRAVARALHGAGFCLVLAGRRRERLEQTAAELGENEHEILPVVCDVAIEASVQALFAAVLEKFSRLDLLFNNAGTGAPQVPMEELTAAQWRAVIDTNLTGAFLCTQAAIRIMKSQQPRGGRIINNGSIAAYTPRPHSAPYTASKHAVAGLTKATALDCRGYDIACGQIDIGNAATDLTQAMGEGILQANGSVRAEPRMDVDHVGRAVLHMASLPLDANVLFMTIMATNMPYVGRG